jgi:hypothetical protein
MTDSELRTSDGGDEATAESVLVERAIGVLMLALQQPPEAVAHALEAAARRHHLPVHDLAEAGVTAAQGRLVQSPLPQGAVGGVGGFAKCPNVVRQVDVRSGRDQRHLDAGTAATSASKRLGSTCLARGTSGREKFCRQGAGEGRPRDTPVRPTT